MTHPLNGVHAMKVSQGAGRIKMVSVTTDGTLAHTLSSAFRKLLYSALAAELGERKFNLVARGGRIDWYITFDGTYSEEKLDKLLNNTATSLRAAMYMSPSIPLEKVMADPRGVSYVYTSNSNNSKRTN